jgi:hypothetical protein
MLEEHVFDLLPGYALGCLDEEDLLKVARHLPVCVACRSDLLTYWPVTDQLALAAPPRIPSPDLRAKILQQVGAASPADEKTTAAQPAARAPSGPARPAPFRNTLGDILRSLWTRPVRLAFSAIALLLVVFISISSFILWQRVNDLQAKIQQGNMQLVSLTGTTNAPQAHGYMMVFKNESYGTLVIDNAPRLEAGYQYQLWLIKDGKRTSGGVFSVSEDGYGTLQVVSGQPLDNYASFGITIEPAGGSPAPTGKKVLGGNL